jgi:hypothetical protein
MIFKAINFLQKNGVSATLRKTREKISRYKYNRFKFRILNRLDRSHYAYCCFHAAVLASKLGHKKMSVIEFGCAGGRGLIALENICHKVSEITGIEIEIYGFDTGEGLPEPKGYRDLPYHWQKGFFAMEKDKLEARLKNTKIIYGEVENTIQTFKEKYNPAVIGCVIHDFDFYSSTKAALQLFTRDEGGFLPRSFHYFDDIIGDDVALFSNWTGERLAINEFNDENASRKFDPCYHLITRNDAKIWHHQIRILHLFDHPQYCSFISRPEQQRPL